MDSTIMSPKLRHFQTAMGTHGSFVFRGYITHIIGGIKKCFVFPWVLRVKGLCFVLEKMLGIGEFIRRFNESSPLVFAMKNILISIFWLKSSIQI